MTIYVFGLASVCAQIHSFANLANFLLFFISFILVG